MAQITKHFCWREFEKTSFEQFKYKNMVHDFSVRDNIADLCKTILEPLREAWGKPVIITSGYRCEELNAKVGGVANSAHLEGLAADLQPEGGSKDVEEFAKFAINFLNEQHIRFDQCIIEKSGKSKWLHISLRGLDGRQRMQFMRIEK